MAESFDSANVTACITHKLTQFPYSTISTTSMRQLPQVSSDSFEKVLAGLVRSSLTGMSELGRLQLHPFQ